MSSLCQMHKTVLDKYGKPDDVLPGLLGRREQLPPQPLSGMYNKSGSKVRLTFKMELNQVWIGTKGRLRTSARQNVGCVSLRKKHFFSSVSPRTLNRLAQKFQ